MLSRTQWLIRQLVRRLWFKAGAFGLVAVATALLAIFLSPLVPEELSEVVGADAVRDLLNILASSMLAVATFSLGTMVAAFAAATSNATPRASKLLVEDPTSQNVLSTFVGAFIFSLVGVIALSTGVYGPGGRLVMFTVTVVVIAVVLTTFFRWIDYLTHLGRLSETMDKVERAATEAVRSRCEYPYLGGTKLQAVPAGALAFAGDDIGYVQHLDVAGLHEIAEEAGGEIWVGRQPGAFADMASPLFWTSWQPEEDTVRRIRGAFSISSTRSFDQDPRFGLIVLSEIASRALSPAVNDPGTAIDVIGRVVRVLSLWPTVRPAEDAPRYPSIYVPEISVRDLFDDVFNPISRDSAGTFEVCIRLQKALASLAGLDRGRFGEEAARHSSQALELSDAALQLDAQKAALRDLADRVRPAGAVATAGTNGDDRG